MLAVHLIINLLMKVLGQVGGGGAVVLINSYQHDACSPTKSSSEDVTAGSENLFYGKSSCTSIRHKGSKVPGEDLPSPLADPPLSPKRIKRLRR